MSGVSKSQVSRLCAEIDERVEQVFSEAFADTAEQLWTLILWALLGVALTILLFVLLQSALFWAIREYWPPPELPPEEPRRSVQASLEQALSSVADAPLQVVCAGRTDAGVHGLNQVVHLDAPVAREPYQRPTPSALTGTSTAAISRVRSAVTSPLPPRRGKAPPSRCICRATMRRHNRRPRAHRRMRQQRPPPSACRCWWWRTIRACWRRRWAR